MIFEQCIRACVRPDSHSFLIGQFSPPQKMRGFKKVVQGTVFPFKPVDFGSPKGVDTKKVRPAVNVRIFVNVFL